MPREDIYIKPISIYTDAHAVVCKICKCVVLKYAAYCVGCGDAYIE